MEKRIRSFEPIIDENSQILILGSVPGVKSLEMQQYYAHPQNQFWKILFHLTNTAFISDYNERQLFLKEHRIALWDVIDTCHRKGSLDTAIRNEETNDILKLIAEYSSIKAIFCNGQTSFKILNKIKKDSFNLPLYGLPSTSPAHTLAFEKKVLAWEIIKEYLV